MGGSDLHITTNLAAIRSTTPGAARLAANDAAETKQLAYSVMTTRKNTARGKLELDFSSALRAGPLPCQHIQPSARHFGGLPSDSL